MRKIPITLIIIGLFFTNISLYFNGIDLLIDAVGFLLIWNGVKALQKIDAVYGFANVCSFSLIFISILSLFFTAKPFSFILLGLTWAICGILYFFLIRGLYLSLAKINPQKKYLLLWALLILVEILLLICLILLIFMAPVLPIFSLIASYSVLALLVVALLFSYLEFSEQEKL